MTALAPTATLMSRMRMPSTMVLGFAAESGPCSLGREADDQRF